MHNWQAEGKTRMKAQLARANMLLTDTTMRTKTLLLARMHETQAFAGRTMALLKAKTRTLLVRLCLSLSLRAYQCIHPYSCLLASAALNVCVGGARELTRQAQVFLRLVKQSQPEASPRVLAVVRPAASTFTSHLTTSSVSPCALTRQRTHARWPACQRRPLRRWRTDRCHPRR